MKDGVLILDFDGVICDSIEESFVSSWIAYFNLYLERKPVYMPVSLRKDFARMRPLVRGGEDFMLIQEILEQGAFVSQQAEFDAISRSAGKEKLKVFHDLFYKARAELLAKDRDSWLSMNRIYPHVASAFALLRPGTRVYILSTKKPDFIAEILSAKGISMPLERILYSGSERKMDIVLRIKEECAGREAVFIDDQIDHLAQPEASRGSGGGIRVYLATWGYVREDWLKEPLRVPTITPREFLSLVQREYS